MKSPPRHVCFVTGTRAEFGLMRRTLRTLQKQRGVKLQLVVTGMHLDAAHGGGLGAIESDGWVVDRVVPWASGSGRDRQTTARDTGHAIAGLADAFAELRTDIVLVVGDRVEAFAAASAAHLSGLAVAHVHGGDRAAGQVDDSLRHAITKLAHVHFPATAQSAERLGKLGEDGWRIHRAGSPGLDGIRDDAAPSKQVRELAPELEPHKYALLVLHPVEADDALEARRAAMILAATGDVAYRHIVVVYPNNDPGAGGIIRTWDAVRDPRLILHRDMPRALFLGLMRDAAVLLGNSSSGIIEAASFGTPVLDIGPRQLGRERGGNVVHVPYNAARIRGELLRLWADGRPKRFRSANIYGGGDAARRIARVLAKIPLNERLLRKLIRY